MHMMQEDGTSMLEENTTNEMLEVQFNDSELSRGLEVLKSSFIGREQ